MIHYAAVFVISCVVSVTCGADWTQFRGREGSGVSTETGVPLSWSDQDNIAWKTRLPGAGTSSPIVLGNRIYLTCYSGYGLDASDPGDMNRLVRNVVCLHRDRGTIDWSRPFAPRLPESKYSGGTNAKHGYSSSTLTTDGTHLFTFFGKSGVYCLDLEGNEIWHTTVGDDTRGWGSANSPVLYKNLVIVNASVESKTLVALDKTTGREAWRAGGMRSSWNTPVLVRIADGSTELVVSVQKWLLGFDPVTGEELWRCVGVPTYACPSAISHEGIVYVTGGRGTQYTMAVRAGGRGDVTESHQLWRVAKGSNVSSPVYHDGYLFLASDSRGIAYCFDAENGDVVYQQRLRPKPGLIYSSPILAEARVYYTSQHNGVFVLAAQPEFKLLAHNTFADDDARSNACPVIHAGQILLRNDQYLYCIGKRAG